MAKVSKDFIRKYWEDMAEIMYTPNPIMNWIDDIRGTNWGRIKCRQWSQSKIDSKIKELMGSDFSSDEFLASFKNLMDTTNDRTRT